MWTCLVSWKASSSSWPSSRPLPERFIPPNGPASLSVNGSLIQTVPARSSRAHRIAVSRSRVDVGAEPVRRRVGELDRLVEIGDRHDRGDRAEGLLAQQVGLGGRAGDDGRCEVVAALVAALPPPATTWAPAATADSTWRTTFSRWAALTIGPMSVPGSIGSPTVSVRVWSTNALRKSS